MNKNKFITGFTSGILSTLIVCCLLFSVYVTKMQSNVVGSNGSIAVGNQESDGANENGNVFSKVNTLESIINTYYLEDMDDETLANGIYKGLLQSLGDRYSCYYTKEEYKNLMESSTGVYCGIGASVSQNVETGIVTIVKPFVTGPAYEAGILPNDIIYEVDGVSVTGKDLTEIVSRMKGEAGTTVDITVLRDGEEDPLKFTVNRRTIETPTIEYKMLEDKVGYISISEFDEITAQQYRKALKELDAQGMKGLVIDLRNNPGGQLDTVVDMLDRMLPEGLIVYQEKKDGTRVEQRSTNKEKFTKPLAVIINQNSASASEIFAGAVQDYKAGTIVGTTSFGKGIVQSIIPLNDGTAVKVTVSKYFTPAGRNIHGIGITPDIQVELDEEVKQQVVLEPNKDAQLQSAIQNVKEQISQRK